MIGPHHFQEAELLIAEAADCATSRQQVLLQFAQVHATLAYTAATALYTLGAPGNPHNTAAWRAAILPTPTSSKDNTHA